MLIFRNSWCSLTCYYCFETKHFVWYSKIGNTSKDIACWALQLTFYSCVIHKAILLFIILSKVDFRVIPSSYQNEYKISSRKTVRKCHTIDLHFSPITGNPVKMSENGEESSQIPICISILHQFLRWWYFLFIFKTHLDTYNRKPKW